MTPQEKAKELVNIFIDEIPANQEKDFKKFYKIDHNSSISCAIITVDKIIESRKNDQHFDDSILAHTSDYYTSHPMYLTYWKEVKEHLEKFIIK